MSDQIAYLMESEEEAIRLDLKTTRDAVVKQAGWAGLKPGMRVADIGCGSGKTTWILNELVQPSGEVVGVDGSADRVLHARTKYSAPGLSYRQQDFCQPLDDLGLFDFVWVRFVLEYHRSKALKLCRTSAEF